MMNFNFCNPANLFFGVGTLDKLHDQKLPGKKALLLISSGKSVYTNGSYDKTVDELAKAGISSHYHTLCKYMNFKDQGMILGFGCGTVSMTEKSSYPLKAYELGKSLK